MNKEFSGQVAIVTGAGQGIGFGIARELGLRGAGILLNDEDEGLAVKAASEIRGSGGVCEILAGDVANPAFVRKLVEESIKKFGKLTIAIASAGITSFGDFFTYTPDQLQRVMTVNLGGTFFLAQHAANQMKTQQEKGTLLFLSSVTAHQAHKNLAAYAMTKAGIEMLAKNLVIELSPFGIRVNAIAPGATLTERTLNDADYRKTWAAITPLGRAAEINDIVHAALFLVSPAASHITGQSLIVDGGWTSVSPSPF
jgi:3-oxoacyl-[acyl-carrier protein] reductase